MNSFYGASVNMLLAPFHIRFIIKGTALVSLKCDEKEWTTLSKKVKLKIHKGVESIYFVFNGEDFLFDEWKFTN
ncbi:hypothetical protein HDC90_004778 [Pedobacter sp. AK013]|nr:hypothetical protein [Pedobacter sp. AK013]